MLRLLTILVATTLGWTCSAAERKFGFSDTPLNRTPEGFRSSVTGEGKPGDWKVIEVDAAPSAPLIQTNTFVAHRETVLAQMARDRTDEHFPILIYDNDVYGDFKLTVKLKTVEGEAERMAGVAFRIQDEKNYYVVRVSSLGNNVRFYKFVNGVRSAPIGQDLAVPAGVWHELAVECKGNQIVVLLNGKPAMPALADTSFTSGKIGFWTKSDSVSYFAQARLEYAPRERLVDVLVQETLKKYPKLRGLQLYAVPPGKTEPVVIGARDPSELGKVGGKEERACLDTGGSYMGRPKGAITLLMPLRDRNGEVVAAVRFTMDTFFGQTDNNAIARAQPIHRFMENRLARADQPLQ